MLEELLAHLASARDDDEVRGPRALVDRPHGPLGRRRRPRGARRRRAGVRRMELFARLYDELTGFPKPTVAACHGACVGGGAEIAVACDLRVGGSNLRLRFPGAALGVPVGPARLVTLCGLSVAKYLLLTLEGGRRRHGLPLGPRPQGRARAAHRGGGAAARRRRSPSTRRRPSPGSKRDAARVGRRRGPLARSRARARSTGRAPARACRIASDAAARPARRGLVSGLAGPVTARR